VSRRLAAVSLAFGAVACAGEPEPQPFRGPAPLSIAVLPLRGADLPPALREALDAGAHLALAERGYVAVPAEVVGPTVDVTQPLDRAAFDALRRAFTVDAVLERAGRPLPGVVAGRGTAYAVRWTMLSTGDGRVLWTREETIAPGQVTSRHLVGPQERYEPDPFFSDEPLAGRGGTDWVAEVEAREPSELAAAVQQALALRLPRAPRD
jgi:hypothetical protein